VSTEDPDLDSELAWARVDESVAARRRRRDEVDLLAMESTLGSVLGGAALARAELTVVTTDGRRWRGVVVAASHELVFLERSDDREAARAITALRTASITRLDFDAPVDAQASPELVRDTTMTEVVAGFAGTGAIVSIGLSGGEVVVGEVDWCGEDVAAIRRRDGGATTVVYLASVNDVTSTSTSSSA
jgi:hypothetical protein